MRRYQISSIWTWSCLALSPKIIDYCAKSSRFLNNHSKSTCTIPKIFIQTCPMDRHRTTKEGRLLLFWQWLNFILILMMYCTSFVIFCTTSNDYRHHILYFRSHILSSIIYDTFLNYDKKEEKNIWIIWKLLD